MRAVPLDKPQHAISSPVPQPCATNADFFSQFGKLTRVRLSRNKKTGKAKHYAFLEFQYPEVAQVAADAMDGES